MASLTDIADLANADLIDGDAVVVHAWRRRVNAGEPGETSAGRFVVFRRAVRLARTLATISSVIVAGCDVVLDIAEAVSWQGMCDTR